MHNDVRPFPWRTLLVLGLVYSCLQVSFLGLAPIAGSTEAREAQVIDTIVREHTWILPLRNGVIPSKPPLYHWIGASLSTFFGGASELTARLPSHLGALGILLCAALCSYRLALRGRTIESGFHPRRAALLAPAVLSLTYGFHQLASQAMVDMTFALCAWVGFTAIVSGSGGDTKNGISVSSSARALFWACCALGVVARGPLGIALPIAIVGGAGIFLAGLRRTVRMLCTPSIGWAAFLIPVLWYYAAYQVGGEAFLAKQLLFENVQRFVGGEQVNTEAWWFYGPSLFRTTAPWGILALYASARYIVASRKLSFLGGYSPWMILPSVALTVGVALFSLSSGKRHSYMLPLQPLVAIQCALLFSSFLDRCSSKAQRRLHSLARAGGGISIALLVALLMTLGVLYEVTVSTNPVEGLLKHACAPLTFRIGITALITLLGVALMTIVRPHTTEYRVWALLVVTLTIVVSAGNVVKGTLKGWPYITDHILSVVGPRQHLTVIKEPHDEYFDPVFFYAHQAISIIDARREIPCDPETVYAARTSWTRKNITRLKGDVRRITTVQEIERAFLGDRGDDIDVFTCSPRVADERAPPGSMQLRDARHEGYRLIG